MSANAREKAKTLLFELQIWPDQPHLGCLILIPAGHHLPAVMLHERISAEQILELMNQRLAHFEDRHSITDLRVEWSATSSTVQGCRIGSLPLVGHSEGFNTEARAGQRVFHTQLCVRRLSANEFDITHPTWSLGKVTEREAARLSRPAKPMPYTPVRVFHGMASAALPSVREKGLVPRAGPGGDAYAMLQGLDMRHSEITGRDASVYLTRIPDYARQFAVMAAELTHSRPVMLEVEIPHKYKSRIKEDELGMPGLGVRFEGAIKPQWVRGLTDRLLR